MAKSCGPLVAVLLLLAAPVRAQETCSLIQITNTTGQSIFNLQAAINAAGNRIAFESNASLAGPNSNGNLEIVLWDAFTGFVQITNTTTGESLNPAIDAAGNRVAFESSADPLGSNGDGNFEIFLWDSATGLTQITNTTSGDSTSPSINAAGNRIAFSSTSNPLGGNGDGNTEIFLWDSSTGLTQITNTTSGNSSSPSINAAGNRIAFVSTSDLVGTNSDGNFEIFLWDASAGISQITNTSPLAGNNGSPAINAAGDRIAFESNVGLGAQSAIFLWDSSAGITQITTGFSGSSVLPSIDGAGARIAFRSNEIYLWDASSGFTQITNSFADAPAINAVGNRIAFHSAANLVGTNADGNDELFLAACPALSVVDVPTTSPAGLAALVLLLGLAAAWTLRR